MNIYKDLLFLHGYVLDPKILEDVSPAPSPEAPAERVRPTEVRASARRAPARQAVLPAAATPSDCCA